MPKLYTKRLLLRGVKKSDLEYFHAYSSDPKVGPSSGWEPHADRQRTKYVMKKQYIGNPFAWGIVYDEKLIGAISLDTDRKRFNDRVMMLGYSLSSAYWGRGFMTEAARAVIAYAFNVYEIDGISVYCYPENERSRHIIEKCGFKYEGLLKMAQRRFDGKVKDNLCFFMTGEDFSSLLKTTDIFKDAYEF